MQIIIELPEESYKRCCIIADLDGSPILKAIKNGIPLEDEQIIATLMLLAMNKDYKPKRKGASE